MGDVRADARSDVRADARADEGVGGILNGLWLTGIDGEYVSVPDDAAFSFGNGASTDSPFSLSAWFAPDDFAATRPVLSKRDNTTADNSEWLIRCDSSTGLLRLVLCDNNTSNVIMRTSDVALTAGELVHVVTTYDGSSTTAGMKLYVDGALIASTGSTAGTYSAMHSTTSPVYVGADLVSVPAFDSFFKGHLGECGIYDKELSAAEVLTLYGGTQPSTGLVESWPGTGATNADWEGSQSLQDGTIQGTPNPSVSNDGGATWEEG